MASYTFTPPDWGGQNPHSPTTGAYQDRAGRGMPTERRSRAAAVRIGQMYQLPVLPDPLHSNEAQAFADEWSRDNAPHRNVARDMIVGGVLGGVLSYSLVRTIRRRQAR
jgi:hypothetical protein